MSNNTKKPTGLAITRDGFKFTCTWKIGSKNYGAGQKLEYRVNGGSWKSPGNDPGKTATSKAIALSATDYYPNTNTKLTSFEFRVKGRRAKYTKNGRNITPDWSAWASKDIALRAPAKPTITPTFTSPNTMTFAWSAPSSASDAQPFTRVEYGTVLRAEDLVSNGNNITSGWTSSAGNASGSAPYTESSATLAAGSHTRWFRVRSIGCAGVSDWVYSSHVYAAPFAATRPTAQITMQASAMDVKAYWNASFNAAHPIDTQEVEYCIATPAAGLTVPAGASWQTGMTINGATASSGAHFVVNRILDIDECLFLRVVARHDNNETYSGITVAKVGALEDPTNVSLQQNGQTYRATITATNASDVPDSKLAVIYRPSSAPSRDIIIGVIPRGSTAITVQCPNWSQESAVAFGVYAYQGSETAVTRADGVSQYTISANMKSASVWKGGTVAAAPTNVAASQSDAAGEVILTWDWAWAAADVSEISWADSVNAWESTDEPSKYEINNLHAAMWRVSSLETGKTWYFRVRLGQTNSEGVVTWGPYCDPVACDLSSAPVTPAIYLSDSVITVDGSVTATWAYTTTDGTLQAYAEVCEATISSGGISYSEPIANVRGAQSLTLNAKDLGWSAGEAHNLCVRVVSASGRASDTWSDPATVYVAQPVTCSILTTSLGTVTVIEDGEERDALSLTEMPLTVTITGGDTSKTPTLAIERAETYMMDRPDESENIGYAGETIYLLSAEGATSFTINNDDLIGIFDDGAKYRIVATVKDALGQSASASLDFEVHWTHQAVYPEAAVTIDSANLVAFITPTQPAEAIAGDVCDIYRLSADRPEIVVEGATWGTMYVDPYPTLGDMGGYRCVFRTVNGDYITEDNHIAWTDYAAEDGYILDYQNTVIDFDGDRVVLQYNIDVSNSWKKDFKETQYLGGSVKGDWNASVSRTARVNAVSVTLDELSTIQAMRRLAVYAGICHVRTPDGSSYAADVQVSEDQSYSSGGMLASFTISITRVDPEDLDGVLYTDWVEEQE